MPSKTFYYTKAEIIQYEAKLVLTNLNPSDTSSSYITSLFSHLVQEGNVPGGNLLVTQSIKDFGIEEITQEDYALITPYGNIKFAIIPDRAIFLPNTKYNTVATYRSGEYVSSGFPIITIEVLPDKVDTRKITIEY
jgi:hypothetical protein